MSPLQASGMEQSTSPSNTFVNSGNQPSAMDKIEEHKFSPVNDGIVIINDYFEKNVDDFASTTPQIFLE